MKRMEMDEDTFWSFGMDTAGLVARHQWMKKVTRHNAKAKFIEKTVKRNINGNVVTVDFKKGRKFIEGASIGKKY